MIRQRVRRNLDAELLQGCEELLRMADAGDRVHSRALESFQRTRLAADERRGLERVARTPESLRRPGVSGRADPSRHDTTRRSRLREPAHRLAQRPRRQQPSIAEPRRPSITTISQSRARR